MKKLWMALALWGALAAQLHAQWKPVEGRISTQWSEQVNPDKVLPEYPRPIMERTEWKNLNGLWDYAIIEKGKHSPSVFDGKILVPFAVESSLSGVAKTVGAEKELVYRRSFDVPSSWKGKKVLLHFGAVDWKTDVWVNDVKVGSHTGGFTPFSFDITEALQGKNNTLLVKVWDPTDKGYQPRGKQVSRPEGIWYTPVTGIWQTVWLEPVSESYIQDLRITPDIDNSLLSLKALVKDATSKDLVEVKVFDGQQLVAQGKSINGECVQVAMPENTKLWSPESPFLYTLKVSLKQNGKLVDEVSSYAAMRKYSSKRDANGIVLVKTKEGRKGKRSIVYSLNAQYSQPTVLPKKIDAYTFASVQNQAATADGYGEYHQFSQEEMETIKNQSNPYLYPNTDWYALGLKNFAPEYRHSLSMTGNQKDVNYYLSLAAFDQGSLYTSDALNYSRYNLRSNVNTTFEEIGLKVALNINAAMEKKKYPSYSANTIWDHLNAKSPLDLAYNEDGTLSTVSDNPLMEMDERSGYDKNDGMYLNTQFVADWALPWVKGLSLGTMLYYRVNSSHVKKLSARAPQYGIDGSQLEVAKPSLKEEAYFGESYQFELSASFQRTFADVHSIDAKAVFTAAENTGHDFWASRRDYLSSTVDQLFAGSSTTMQNAGNSKEGGRMGLVGRLKYDFANRYYIEGSFRYDGSDNFAPGHRWGFFPSVALGWDITEEPFFKSFDLKNVDLLKLRGSYGQMGTEANVNRFGYLSTYNMAENAICIGGNLLSGFNEGELTSPELLSWFTRNSLNYGIDVAFLNHRLKGSIDYFFYVTKGGLVNPADRYTTPLGTKLPQIKSKNEHRREGFELSMRWGDSVGDFQYEVGTNMTYYNNLSVVKQEEALSTLKNPYKRSVHQTDYRDVMLIDNGLYQSVGQILGPAD